MNSKRNIVFLGMMGSGKSSIGHLISKKLKLKFYDIDLLIEKKLNMRIPKIFIDKGEFFFRQIEKKITLNILKNEKSVISLGGGAFLNKDIRKEVIKNHISFWLNWDNNTLVKRIINSSKRPLAYNLNHKELINLIEKRSKVYSKALHKINCNKLTKSEIVNEIMDIYETN